MFGRVDFGHDLPCSISRRVVTFEVWCFQICSLLVKTEVAGASAFKLTTTLGWDDNFKGATFLLATCLSFV